MDKMPSSSISIHALLAESDVYAGQLSGDAGQFLSTLSLRRATSCKQVVQNLIGDFYPRSPCGERHLTNYHFTVISDISIHALLAESDNSCIAVCNRHGAFLSTLSLRRATFYLRCRWTWHRFLSTLSLRRATVFASAPPVPPDDFYPRSPCGERQLRLLRRAAQI